ncbi:MAG: D-glycerate dehydrogenase [Actinomycetia bacterium]|nr:D-glycerate dehydrogenase [Actinomycetes bacterium]
MTAPRVLVTRHLPEGGLDPLIDAGYDITLPVPGETLSHDDVVALIPGHAGLVCDLTDLTDAAVIEAGAPTLRIVATVSVGFDKIDRVAAAAHDVAVTNTPGVLDETTADLAFLLILTAARRSSGAEADLRAGRWTGWAIDDHLGTDVHGATLGVVGFGRIGRAVARRAEGFGMTVLHSTRRPTGIAGYVDSLDELLERADIVSLHIPLTPETRGLIGAKQIARMKEGSVLINTARGPIVDEDALVDALESGHLFAAGLDVFDGEPALNPRLLTAPNLTILPHIGSATHATRRNMAQMSSASVVTVLQGGTPDNLVPPPL